MTITTEVNASKTAIAPISKWPILPGRTFLVFFNLIL